MSLVWSISYVVLWLLVLVGALVVLALAREVETLHARLESALEYLGRSSPAARTEFPSASAGVRSTGEQ